MSFNNMNFDNVRNEIKSGLNTIQDGIYDFRDTTTQAVQKTYKWELGETLTLLVLLCLGVYVLYLLVTKPLQRTVNNWLLLIIALALFIQIQQNVNVVNKLQ